MSNANFEISFSELRCKEVINASDGRKLGRITDIVFSGETGKIKGIVTPYVKRSLFGKGQDVFIPWRCVKKIGEDVIIVDINGAQPHEDHCSSHHDERPPAPPKEEFCKPDAPQCDRRCEKCMLFDCEYRWKA